MTLRTGKYGPYIDCAGIYASVPKSVFSEGGPSLEQAIELVTKKMHKMEKEGGGDVDRR